MMTTWPWLAVEVSRYVHLTSIFFGIFFMAHTITVIIFSCSRKKEIKKLLPSDLNTGSISCRAPKNENQIPQSTPPQSNDKITSTEKEKATGPLSSAKQGSEAILPSAATQITKEEKKAPSEKVEKKIASKKENDKSAKPKEQHRPQATSHSTNLKADQERSNYPTNTSNSKISGVTGETKAIRSGGKTETTQSEVSKTQSVSEKSKKSSRSKRSKRERKGK